MVFLEEQNNCTLISSEENATKSNSEFAYQVIDFHNKALAIIPLISIALNSFSLYIFLDKIWQKSILSILLKYLSITEVVFNASGFLVALTRLIDYSDLSHNWKVLAIITLQIGTFSTASALICRNWSILYLAAYRFEIICKPISSNKLFSAHSTPIILWITYFIACCIALPRIFEQEAYLCSGVLQFRLNLLNYAWYRYGYQGSLIFIIQTGVPVIATIVLSICVVRVIWRMKKVRAKRQRQKQRNQANLASTTSPVQPVVKKHDTSTKSGDLLMLFICISFFTLEIPSFFSKILQFYLQKSGQITQDMILALIGNLFLYSDSLINVFVYIVANPLFRRKVRDILHLNKSNDNVDIVTHV